MNTIGQISACIAGDHRYSTTLEVVADATGVEVILVSASPAGGMDSFTPLATTRKVVARIAMPSPRRDRVVSLARELVRVLRSLFSTIDAGTIARYGKPTKRFAWFIEGERELGLSVKLASEALEDALLAHDRQLNGGRS